MMDAVFVITDSNGNPVKRVRSFGLITDLVEAHDEWFENGKATISTGSFKYEFDKTVKPQDIRNSYYDYMAYPRL